MNGNFAGGLASGLAGGFTLADNFFTKQGALARQDVMDQAALTDREEGRALQERQVDLSEKQVENAQKNAEANQALAAGALGLNSTREQRAADQQTIENKWRGQAASDQHANSALQRQVVQQGLTEKQEMYPLEKEAKGFQMDQLRWDAARQKVPFVMEALKRGAVDPSSAHDFYETLMTATHGIPPERWANGDMLPVFRTVRGIVNGQIPMNSPEANQALAATFPNLMKRGLGEKAERPEGKGTIVSKDPAGMFESPDHPGMLGFGVKVNVKGENGKDFSYVAPVTVHGTSDPNDQALLVSKDALENHYVGLLKLQDAIMGDPDLATGITNLAMTVRQSPKDAAETDLKKAQAQKYRAEAGQLTTGGAKDEVLKRVHTFIDKRLGGTGLDATGFDPGAMDKARVLAGQLREVNPNATAEEIYGTVMEQLNRDAELKAAASGGKGTKAAAPAGNGNYSSYWGGSR
jgi:hypothetical protein